MTFYDTAACNPSRGTIISRDSEVAMCSCALKESTEKKFAYEHASNICLHPIQLPVISFRDYTRFLLSR